MNPQVDFTHGSKASDSHNRSSLLEGIQTRSTAQQHWLATLAAGCLLAGVATAPAADTRTICTAGLLEEMTSLAGLAEFPSPAYTCRQFSSYDRKSKSPKEEWFANADAGQYLRVEEREGRKEFVMMDATGPGAIVRIWSANPAGTLRFYLDGSDRPVLQAPMSELLGGKFPGLPQPIAGEYSKGWNLYFPIPYARSCKVTSDKGDFYYHVNYRTYEAGTPVESFHAGQLQALAAPLEKLAARLRSPRGSDAELGGETQPFDLELPPGESLRQEFTGPRAFTRSVVKLAARDREAALRGIIVKVTFDGEPAVEAPLGDFFGSAPGISPYAALPLGMTKEGEMYCHWFMPFQESAVLELVNHSQEAAALTGEIGLADYRWTDASMHFHARWRAQFDVPTRPMQDWNYLTAQGRGVFAGVTFAIDNPVKDWWGEGDEKIYVDGESFPSHFGTGTEDYYGYAWCWPVVFTHAFHAQPRCDGPGNYGRTSVNRFHILDRIPFTKDFKFDMELWHWHATCKVNMAVVAYWYARPGAMDAFKPIRAEDAVVRPLPVWVVPRVAGALEGESLKIVRVTGTAEPQDWDGVSGGKHLWWHAGMKPGDTLTVSFAAPKAGRHRVIGRFLSARDYGVHQLAINGQKAGDPVDFYNPEVRPGKEMDFGAFELKQGENEFSASVIGANEKAIKSYMLGLDYLLLKRAE
ncbi:MAG: DUF2961 domain-containing protein [Chloroflexi bacterium]|nr:DUF2961 domain-containing protein [Chloroflexota bacterium]